ncbi:MAG: hypothetical protein HKP58_09800 [Desulfatitalea sp.]|nr:hypothetical protein [Desulfatitalea sp.]NNK00695.1 hypothetical protein [Desulfatitalea sp.]
MSTDELQATFEQTDSGEHNYILREICEQLAGIRAILSAGHEASEAMRAQAQVVLEAHQQSAQEYIQQVDQPEPPDFFPFISIPEGTTVRDLPEGGRLFTLADGVLVRANADSSIVSIGLDASVVVLEPARGGVVTLSDGRELTLHPSMLIATHEAAGIEGLPVDIDPVLVAEGRYRIDLPDSLRLDLNHKARMVTVSNPDGTIDILGISRIEGVGEKVTVRLLAGGSKGFTCSESGHGGLIQSDGTIHLSLKGGQDLVIHFSDTTEQDADGTGYNDEPCAFVCERRDS